jgi:hypothetical protein
MTGTEKTMCVRMINQIPELTKLNPLDPQSNRTDNPKDDVGIIKGTLSIDLMKPPYHLLLIMNAKGIAMHIAMKVEMIAASKDVRVASRIEAK